MTMAAVSPMAMCSGRACKPATIQVKRGIALAISRVKSAPRGQLERLMATINPAPKSAKINWGIPSKPSFKSNQESISVSAAIAAVFSDRQRDSLVRVDGLGVADTLIFPPNQRARERDGG